MKINNKGFTLVELLAVLAIIAIIGMIAVPNVISVVDNNKKDLMLQDAQKFVSLVKTYVIQDREFRDSNETSKKYYLKDVDTNNILVTDPDGGKYTNTAYYGNSYVTYTKGTQNSSGYCVYLEGSKRVVKQSEASTSCVPEEELSNRKHVIDK